MSDPLKEHQAACDAIAARLAEKDRLISALSRKIFDVEVKIAGGDETTVEFLNRRIKELEAELAAARQFQPKETA